MAHVCPSRGCNVRIRDDSILMCKKHWYELMREERAQIHASYKANGAGPTHSELINKIVDRQAIRMDRGGDR